MAELVGLVSAGAGLASLSVQLLESSLKLRKIYQTMRSAPEALQSITEEIKLFGLLLRAMEQNRQSHEVITDDLLTQSILLCQQGVAKIRNLTEKLDSAFCKTRLLGKLRFAADEKELSQLCSELERAKNSLSLAYQFYMAGRIKDRDEMILQNVQTLQALTGQTNSLILSVKDHPRTHQDAYADHSQLTSAAQDLECQSTTTYGSYKNRGRAQLEARYRKIRKYRIQPWFFSKIWDVSIQQARSGWTIKLRETRTIPRNSRIFNMINKGDIAGLRKLLVTGEFSPTDCDDRGDPIFCEIFHKLATSNATELCHLLISFTDFDNLPSLYLHYQIVLCMTVLHPQSHDVVSILQALFDSSFDADFLMEYDLYGLPFYWRLCRSLEYQQIMQRSIPVPYNSLPLTTRIKNALGLCSPDPETYLEAIGPFTSSNLRTLQTKEEIISQLIAREQLFGINWPYDGNPYRDLFFSLLEMGADLHATIRSDELLKHVLRNRGISRQPHIRLQNWLELLTAANVNLSLYGSREYENVYGWKIPYFLNASFIVEQLVYGDEKDDWDLIGYLERRIPVWDPEILPGSWIAESPPPRRILCDIEDDEEWPTLLDVKHLWKKEYMILRSRSVASSSLEHHLPVPPAHFHAQDSRDDLLVSELRHAASRFESQKSRRSLSAPADIRSSWDIQNDHDVENSFIDGRNYLNHCAPIHRCRLNSRWRFGGVTYGEKTRYRDEFQQLVCMRRMCGVAEEQLYDEVLGLPILREITSDRRGRQRKSVRMNGTL